jgi:MFS family permease
VARGSRLHAVTDGAPVAPLLVLFALNLVDEFDRVAFSVLTPEIRDTFGVSDSTIVGIASLVGVTSLFVALPIGVLADRVRRVRLAGAGAAAWAGFTVLTAVAPTVGVLLLARIGAGVGRIVNEPVHASLLSDYYAPTTHPRVFALHRLANPVGLGSAVVVGTLATFYDWRLVFGLLCVPTLLLLPVLLRLREPVRGATTSAATVVAAAAGATPPASTARQAPPARETPSAREARAELFRVPTLRRLWLALPVVGVAIITLPQLTSLFFERVYGYGPAGRGVVAFLAGVGIVLGLVLGQRVATRALRDGRPERLALYDGLAVLAIGVALIGVVLAPTAPLSAFFYLLEGVAVGAYQPCYFSLVALVSGARVRAQAYAYAILFLGVGALASPLLAQLADARGYRVALGVLGVTLVVGGAVTTTATRTVRADAARAAQVPAFQAGSPGGPSGTERP